MQGCLRAALSFDSGKNPQIYTVPYQDLSRRQIQKNRIVPDFFKNTISSYWFSKI